GSRHDPLECRIRVVSLNESPSYDALSYCWGPEEDNKPTIAINDCPAFPVRRNLQVALQHLRDESRIVTLWVDALCINQGNHAEKDLQVPMIGLIYEKAANTHVWLGVAADGSSEAMRIIGNLDADQLDRERNEVGAEGLTAIQKLLQRPCRSRVWIVQEALLSANPVVRCGDVAIPMSKFARLDDIRRGRHHEKQQNIDLQNSITRHSFALSNPSRKAITEGTPSRLSAWAPMLTGFHASDPKDKIYGLLGLCTQEDRDVNRVMYGDGLTLVQVYTRAQASFLVSDRSLIHLQFDQDNKAMALKDVFLYSWVPDFSQSPPTLDPRRVRPPHVPLTGGYQACGHGPILSVSIQAPNPFSPGAIGLHLRGLEVDEVVFKCPNPHIEPYLGLDDHLRRDYKLRRVQKTLETVASWKLDAEMWARAPYDDSNADGGSGTDASATASLMPARLQAFWRTVTANRAADWSRFPLDTPEEQ
ncbi:heterokaryon incompatibility protein-domain-containing protein, partial [Lasiosphaeria ovina]